MLDKKEVVEGGAVMINCPVPEEKGPVHFTVKKRQPRNKRYQVKNKKIFSKAEFRGAGIHSRGAGTCDPFPT